jgi:hypothetical protein
LHHGTCFDSWFLFDFFCIFFYFSLFVHQLTTSPSKWKYRVEAYHSGMNLRPNAFLGKLRVISVVVGTIWLIVELFIRIILPETNSASNLTNALYAIFLVVVLVIGGGGFLTYGILIRRRLNSSESLVSNLPTKRMLQKVNLLMRKNLFFFFFFSLYI